MGPNLNVHRITCIESLACPKCRLPGFMPGDFDSIVWLRAQESAFKSQPS